jgi:hypothetical protein
MEHYPHARQILVSNSATPSKSPGTGGNSARWVAGLSLDGKALSLTDERLLRGFHAPERHGAQLVRWTETVPRC